MDPSECSQRRNMEYGGCVIRFRRPTRSVSGLWRETSNAWTILDPVPGCRVSSMQRAHVAHYEYHGYRLGQLGIRNDDSS